MTVITIVIVFVLSLAVPVFAMTHVADYKWDGTVDMQRQVGHWCNTGAEQKVNIEGDGWMERTSDVTMSAGKLTVEKDSSVFETAEDASTNLTVTSVIELCAPPKSEFTTTHYVPVDSNEEPGLTVEINEEGTGFDIVKKEITDYTATVVIDLLAPGKHEFKRKKYSPSGEDEWDVSEPQTLSLQSDIGYKSGWNDFYHKESNPDIDEIYSSLQELLIAETELTESDLENLTENEIKDKAHEEEFAYYLTEVEEVTEQTWAVQVTRDPGESGVLKMDIKGAYGNNDHVFDDGEYWDEEDGYVGPEDGFGFVEDDDTFQGYYIEQGKKYEGNYFHINQHASTTGGTIKRYINIGAIDGAYLHEDWEESGKVHIEEWFNLTNIEPGDEVDID